MFSEQFEALSTAIGPFWTIAISTAVIIAAVFIGGYLVSDRPAPTSKPHKNLTKTKRFRV